MGLGTLTVPVRFINDLLANAKDKPGYQPDCILRAGISPRLLELDGARITMEIFSDLYQQVAVDLDDETPGMFSRPLRSGTLKFLCLSLLEASSLKVALHRFTGFFHLLLDDIRFEIHHEQHQVHICLIECVDLGQSRILALELMLMLVQGVSSWMIGRKIPFTRIDFPFSPPAHAAEYQHLYPGPTYFDQEVTALHMDPIYMQQPIRRDKTALSAFLRNAPMDWFYVSDSERPYTHRLQELLKEKLKQKLTVDDVAHELHTSTRTLARHLAAEGSSFQQIKDKLRRDMAIEWLNKTKIPVATIGLNLGFDDPTAFNRAFRLWTGSAPGVYRKQTKV